MIGGIPGRVMGVVRGGRVGIPGMVGGVGAGMVTPVKIGGGAAAAAAGSVASVVLGATKSASVGTGPNMA